MKNLFKNKYVQIGLIAFCVFAASVLFYFLLFKLGNIVSWFSSLLSIMAPLFVGLVLAYIMHPIVNFFENKVFNKIKKETVKRNLSILCTMIIIFGILVALVSIIIPQLLLSIQTIIVQAPTYFTQLKDGIMKWLSNTEIESTIASNYDNISNYLMGILNNNILPSVNSSISKLSGGIFSFLKAIFNLAIGFVFAVYILANTKNFGAQIRKTLYSFFDAEKVNGFIKRVKHINYIFGKFMVGKVCDSSIVALCTFTFLIIFKFPYALLIAVIIGLTDLIPYFGPYIGTVPSALLICLVDPVKAITFILFIVVLQQIDGNLITPRIQKQATGLPSFWVLFAITLFGGLFGIIGLLIAVPCFTIIYEIIVDYINDRLKTKNMPTSTDFYSEIEDLKDKKIDIKIEEE